MQPLKHFYINHPQAHLVPNFFYQRNTNFNSLQQLVWYSIGKSVTKWYAFSSLGHFKNLDLNIQIPFKNQTILKFKRPGRVAANKMLPHCSVAATP